MHWISALFFVILSHSAGADQARTSCTPYVVGDPHITQADFPFSTKHTLETIKTRFSELYKSPKRLMGRTYFDPSSAQLKVPILLFGAAQPITVPRSFITTVTRQVEMALRRHYADFIFFADMGHSHFVIPQERWDNHYNKIPVPEMYRLYEDVMNDPMIRIFYHTGEQINFSEDSGALLPDRYLLWRYFSRNIVGQNFNPLGILEVLVNPDMNAYNTVQEYPGHQWFGGGFYIHSNEKGCFPYKTPDGSVLYFDLSYESFPY